MIDHRHYIHIHTHIARSITMYCSDYIIDNKTTARNKNDDIMMTSWVDLGAVDADGGSLV